MRNRKFSAIIALLLAFAGLTAGAAGADTTTVTATASGAVDGTRTLALTPVVLTDAVTGATDISGAFEVDVVETAKLGDNWSVTASMSDLAPDAATTTLGGTTIDAGAVSFASTAPAITSTSGTSSVAVTSGTAMAKTGTSTVQLASATQDAAVYYSDLHAFTSVLKLTPPTGTVTGTYGGTMTVTLID